MGSVMTLSLSIPRNGVQKITPKLVGALGDRHRGIGFDQLAVISDSPEC